MADSENQRPAEQSQAAAAAAAAAAEVMAPSTSRAAEADGAAAQAPGEPQGAAENAARPKNDFIDSLPNSVKCRVLALKKLQKRCDKIEAKFDKEFQALERKYNDIYKPLLAKIQELTGEMEDCAWTMEADDDEDDDFDDDDYEDEEDGDEEPPEAGSKQAAAGMKDGGARAEMPDDAKQ
ncbi:nucleosome assembly protein 1-like 5 [Lemur catta]|uniref:nucleosome assembly protein 1-like 5 n=1 Tax=Lemur catta TaxID=9447 RepID=UPI001E268F03|nr:nucleosome assembly protein 1-like 5 [Lemur catta]